MREAERALARQAEAAYERTVADWQRTQAKRKGAGATPGRASQVGRQAAKQRGRAMPQGLRFSSSSPTPEENSRKLEELRPERT